MVRCGGTDVLGAEVRVPGGNCDSRSKRRGLSGASASAQILEASTAMTQDFQSWTQHRELGSPRRTVVHREAYGDDPPTPYRRSTWLARPGVLARPPGIGTALVASYRRDRASVDHVLTPVDRRGPAGHQERDQLGDLFRTTGPADRNPAERVHEALPGGHLVPATLLGH